MTHYFLFIKSESVHSLNQFIVCFAMLFVVLAVPVTGYTDNVARAQTIACPDIIRKALSVP